MARLLLVEDDPDVRTLFEHVLLSDGYVVEVAPTLAHARALLNANRYDLVLTDADLPDGSGIVAAQEAERGGMKAIIVTAFGLRLSAEELHEHDIILKPVRPNELLRAVAGLLNPSPVG